MMKRIGHLLPRLGILAAAAALLLGITAGLGTRWEVWHFSIGLRLLRISAYGACIGGAVSLVGMALSLLRKDRAGIRYTLIACILSGILVGVPAYWAARAHNLPAIHDITTDIEDPPQFYSLLKLRGGASNPPVYGGLQIASQQRLAYPDIVPLVLPGTGFGEVFDRALMSARRMGWNIISADRGKGIIEAVAASFWFGFKDDVVIRLREVPNGVRIDLRSASRVGISDLGANASRIRRFLRYMAG